MKEILSALLTIGITAVACYLLFGVAGGIVMVRGNSMYPTYRSGRLLPMIRTKHVSFGDVIVIRCDVLRQNIIKRVIGVPGDTIEIRQGTVYRNGEALTEPYAYAKPMENMDPVTVEDGKLFLLGDNRMHSMDSRSARIGRLRQSDILGKIPGGKKKRETRRNL